jgi:hypothetical protein
MLCFDFKVRFCHSASWKDTLSGLDSGLAPRRAKAIFLQFVHLINNFLH